MSLKEKDPAIQMQIECEYYGNHTNSPMSDIYPNPLQDTWIVSTAKIC